MDIDIRIGRLRISWSPHGAGAAPLSAREAELEAFAARADARHEARMRYEAEDLLEVALSGAPERHGHETIAKRAALALERLRLEVASLDDSRAGLWREVQRYQAFFAHIADAVGSAQSEDLGLDDVLRDVRSLKARAFPIARAGGAPS